ncbi:MAG: glycosyltransferase family 4 protein [Acidobacteriota bacterium]
MKLLYVHFLYGEDTALNHVRQFSEAARALGHKVDVEALNFANADGRGSSDEGPDLRAAVKKRLGRYLHEPKEILWNRRYARRLGALLDEKAPDVLLARDEVLNYSFAQAASRRRVPLVVEVNAPAVESRLYLDQYWHVPLAANRIEAWKLRRADQVTVVSGALRDHLVSRHGLAADKFTVVPNGADVDVFHPEIEPAPEVAALEPGVVVGFVGSFQKWHGTEMLSSMAQSVGAEHEHARFLFVGDGPQLEPVRCQLEDLGPRVLLTGRRAHAEVPGLVAGFDIGVVAQAAFYMSPLKVLEWMAAGVAVVAPAYGPLQELIDDGVHGLLFEPDSVKALTNAVARLVADPELRQRLGAAATARVREELTWTDNARKVLGACDKALGLRGKAA